MNVSESSESFTQPTRSKHWFRNI